MTENLLEAPERSQIEALLKKSHASPAQAPTFERLLGFLSGAVVTPGGFMAEDWLQPLFDLNGIVFKDVDDIDHCTASLISLYERLDATRLRKEMLFPFDMKNLDIAEALLPMIDWATGLHCAVIFQEDIWIPEEGEADFVDDKLKMSVNLNIQSLTTLVDPKSIPDIVKDPIPFQRNVLSLFPDWQEDQLRETWDERLIELFRLFALGRLDAIMDSLQAYATAYDEADNEVVVIDASQILKRGDGE
jgi:hypothetical protein